jgi:hypothetical protein
LRQFLVEVFVPRSQTDALATAEERAREAASRLSDSLAEIRYVRTTYVPEDETCFYAFEAASAELVAKASRLAGLGEGRIVEATTHKKGEG